MHYNKLVTEYKEHKEFFNRCANVVIEFCNNNNISYHIKKGTKSSTWSGETMKEKIKFTPEQLNELQSFFQQNDFTSNMALEREHNSEGEQAKILSAQRKSSVNTGS